MTDENKIEEDVVIPTEGEARVEESLKADPSVIASEAKQSPDKQNKAGLKQGFFKKKECKDCEKTKAEAEEYKLGWQRALADYKNLQREIATRSSEWAQHSERQILEEFIPVYDHLKLAINNEQLASNKDPWLEGVRYVAKQFADILKSHSVEEIKTVGEKLDTRYHEAVGEEEVEDKESGMIIKETDGGYKMGERVIKPAKVIISK